MIDTRSEALPLRRRALRLVSLPLVLLMTASAFGQPALDPAAATAAQQRAMANVASVGFHRDPRTLLAEHRRFAAALAGLKPQRGGAVDAYVVVAGLDSDPVFGREAREAARILSRRFGAAGRTIVMTAEERASGDAIVASPANLAVAFARVAELMDRKEDVLIVYTTSHGSAPAGLAYRDKARGAGAISPDRYAAMLADAGIANRMIIVSACYSGIFVPKLASETSIVVSAAAADRSSFGCSPGNDWTYFGDAFLNRALRRPQDVRAAFAEASKSVAGWEAGDKFKPSNPQISVGRDVGRWLGPLEKRMPRQASRPVGRSPAARAGAPAK